MDYKNVDPVLVKTADYLLKTSKSGLKLYEGVLSDRRAHIFKGSAAVQALTSETYRQAMKNEAALSKVDASGLLKEMMKQGFFIRAARIENTKHFQPEVTKAWSDEAFYGWVYQGSQLTTILGAVLLLVVSFVFVMYPLWPASMKGLVWYAFMALAGFIGFLVVLSILRLILFSITMFSHSPGIWLFPNLFEDVGFFASFVPLWDWHKVGKAASPESDKSK